MNYEDWNKGYEKGRDDYCCNHNCNQGRDCPLRTKTLTEPSVKEITDLWLDVINNIPANDKRPREWHFANAILRKAQEKT